MKKLKFLLVIEAFVMFITALFNLIFYLNNEEFGIEIYIIMAVMVLFSSLITMCILEPIQKIINNKS